MRQNTGDPRSDAEQIAQPQPRDDGKTRARFLLGISLALLVVGSIGAHVVKTAGGRIDVIGLKLPTENGQWIVADLFRPKTATEKNPVPMVVVCPGFERSKETMDAYAIELARRGMAVITIDPYNQGASSSTRQRRTDEWLYVNLLLGVIPMMFVLPYFNRYFFRITGKVYLGPMITCLIFIMMMLTSNVCYIPLE